MLSIYQIENDIDLGEEPMYVLAKDEEAAKSRWRRYLESKDDADEPYDIEPDCITLIADAGHILVPEGVIKIN